MDSSSQQNEPGPGEHICALVNEYFDRRQAGEDLTPASFAAEHPEVAETLRRSLEGLSLVDKARMLANGADSSEVPGLAAGLSCVEGYKLIEEIGRGGMGVVYRALQVSTKRVVALKVMLGGPFASEIARKRFRREVELAARLQHPAIVRVLEGGDVAGQPYYAMDYVAGRRLNRYLAASQPDVRTMLSLFMRLCQVVEYAHQRGVINRDLKPANVLIDEEGNPHILDFGLAKATDQAKTDGALSTRVSLPGQVMGTLSYLSPEQASGIPEQIDAHTDVYALGTMLFEALTGSLPLDTTGRASEVIQRIVETTPTRPSSLSNRVDGELETIMLKALEKEQTRRYQSAAEMADDIRRYLEGEPILARRPSSFYVLGKKLRKHRLAVILSVAVVALGLIGLAAGVWRREHDLARARRDALYTQRALESQMPRDALGPAQTLHARYPQLPEALLVWAQALYRNERPVQAIGVLKGAPEGDPSGWAFGELLAEFYQAAGDAERAGELRARAKRATPDTAEAWYLRSFATLDRQRALQCAQQAVQGQPSYALAWERLTWLCLETGDLDGALGAAEKLIELGEDARRWNLFRGHVFARQNRFRKAIEEYTRAGAYDCRAHVYRRIKEYDKAVTDYTNLVEGTGESTAAVWHFYQRATPLWILGRTDEAVEDYRRVRVLLGRPFYSDARHFLILRGQGRQREAQEVLAAALREVQDHWLRQIFRCLAGELGPDELVADGAARDNREQLCEAYYYAGEVCLLLDQPAQARNWFERCVQTGVEFDPDTAPATPMNEYELAEWRLASLFADDPPTPHP